MSRKFSIILLNTFFRNQMENVTFSLLLLLTFFLVFHLYHQPYTMSNCNSLETFSLYYSLFHYLFSKNEFRAWEKHPYCVNCDEQSDVFNFIGNSILGHFQERYVKNGELFEKCFIQIKKELWFKHFFNKSYQKEGTDNDNDTKSQKQTFC